jgi:hypothetical protein
MMSPRGRSSGRTGNDLEAGVTGCARSAAAEAIWRITGDRSPARQVGRGLLGNEDWFDRQSGESLLVFLGDLM